MTQEQFALLVGQVRKRVFNPDTDTVESPARQSPNKWDHEGKSTRVIFQNFTATSGWVTHHCLTRKGSLAAASSDPQQLVGSMRSHTDLHWATGTGTKPCRRKTSTLVEQPGLVTCPTCLFWLCGRLLDAEQLLLKMAAIETKLHALEKQIGPNLTLAR